MLFFFYLLGKNVKILYKKSHCLARTKRIRKLRPGYWQLGEPCRRRAFLIESSTTMSSLIWSSRMPVALWLTRSSFRSNRTFIKTSRRAVHTVLIETTSASISSKWIRLTKSELVFWIFSLSLSLFFVFVVSCFEISYH